MWLTCRPGDHDGPVPGPVHVAAVAVLYQARHDQAQVDGEKQDMEEDELSIVADVGEGPLPRNWGEGISEDFGDSFGLRRHQPPVNTATTNYTS